ncbi:metalloregulator ArsR/SmtB family transcription factor [Parvularcula sp. IMCC14364]|uniref:helix-turn-helix transcriptional regulator n=1 Tax=Parvularcula sp. IMCC14364 TaxID=3067902 RepID=UPI002741EC58|nr:metalloregulator ArsR/SmtB family transcription factor [Parvularcula sp. IMCC14364]
MSDDDSTPLSATSTRQIILDRLKRHGEQSAADLAAHLSLTTMAVRLQLYDLAEEGLVEARAVSSGRGRPTKLWHLTDAAARIFPDAHQGLAVELINSVEALFGAAGLKKVVDRHADSQRKSYTALLAGARSLGDRAKRLAGARTDEGYMAEAVREGRDWLLIENHCPVCSAARTCTSLCANELEVFQDVLGLDVRVTREEHILQGARRCAYRISKA